MRRYMAAMSSISAPRFDLVDPGRSWRACAESSSTCRCCCKPLCFNGLIFLQAVENKKAPANLRKPGLNLCRGENFRLPLAGEQTKPTTQHQTQLINKIPTGRVDIGQPPGFQAAHQFQPARSSVFRAAAILCRNLSSVCPAV